MATTSIPLVTFNNGQKCPMLGLGTWNVSNFQIRQNIVFLSSFPLQRFHSHFSMRFRTSYNPIFTVEMYIMFQSLEREVYEAVCHAIDLGYRHFDCAYYYQNEGQIGEAIQDKISQGVITREDIFITTKVRASSLCYLLV